MMQSLRIRLAAILALLCLALASASPIAAAPGDNGNGNPGGNGNGNNGNGNAFGHDKKDSPALSATPELSSLVLFGSTAAGAAGYALLRIRAARREGTHTE